MLDSECIDELIDPIDMEENDFGDNLTYYERALENIYTLIKWQKGVIVTATSVISNNDLWKL